MEYQLTQPVKLFTTDGFNIENNGNDVVTFGNTSSDNRCTFYTDILMNNNFITNLHSPQSASDAATKLYVDNSRKSYVGYIPSLASNVSKMGFIVSASSELNRLYGASNAFKSDAIGEWCTSGINNNFWIMIRCPDLVRVWRFRLKGRNSDVDRIYNWRFEGSVDAVTWITLYTGNNDYIGYAIKTYNIFEENENMYSCYRVYCVDAEKVNPGLSYLQLYICSD
jgi:hypothetical protein